MKRLIALLMALSVTTQLGADWLQFRGQSGAAAAPDSKLPTKVTEDNVAWKVELIGKGPSSPIVVGDRVIVTCGDGPKQKRLVIVCHSAKTGELLWRRDFWATGRTATHPTSGVAAPTPVCDGKHIYAFYSSNDLVCLDLDGNLVWYRGLAFDYPKAGNDIGMSSSPAIVGDTVVVQIENQGDSFAAGLNKLTGETRWRIKRRPVANWASPIGLPNSKGEMKTVLLQSPSGLTAHDPMTGKEIWKFDDECQNITSSVAVNSRIYLPSRGITALEISDDSTSPEVVWQSSQVSPGPASPILHDGKLYVVGRGGILTCANAKNGDVLWKLRTKSGSYWGTPVLANGHIYLVNQAGQLLVVDATGEKGKLVSQFELGATIQTSPAVAGNAMYVRSNGHLWKIAN